MKKINRRWNKFSIGLSLGLLLPLATFFAIYLFSPSKASIVDFVKFTYMMQALAKIMSLCVVPNLAVFYLFLNMEFWYATRGVIAATLLCTLSIVTVLFIL